LKKLAGNPGKRPLNDREPQPPVPAGKPYAPRFLCEEGKKEWRKIIPVLMELGLYTELDHAALEMYCQAYGRWIEAEKMLDATGGMIIESTRGTSYYNQWYGVADKMFERVRKMLAEFGLSPGQRSRVVAAARPEQMSLAELLFQSVADD